jgi:2-polyprenyl-6-methoxyphenol hydroxylase-like FAD-dependent oxidoreductase
VILPGFLAELHSAGALVLDDANMSRIYVRNGRYTFNRTDPVADPAALTTFLASRPFVEFHLRRRIEMHTNVTFLENHDVGELLGGQPGRINGVRVSDRATGEPATVHAELVVDATGRGSRTPLLLEQRGYSRPPQRTFATDGVYYSQQLTIPEHDAFPERMLLVLPKGSARRGGLIAQEHDTWTLTIAGRTAEMPTAPTALADMLTLAAEFVPRHILPALQTAHAISNVSTYRYPGGVWRRYDQMADHPEGLVALGDALCCLDPIKGQGMTLAGLHALTLRKHLDHANPISPQQFYRDVAAHTAPVWRMNQPSQRHTTAHGKSALAQRAVRWGSRKMLEAAHHDIVVTERLMRVTNLVDPPQRLLEPPLLARVLIHHTRQSMARRLRR